MKLRCRFRPVHFQWTLDQQRSFVEGILDYGRAWKKIQHEIQPRVSIKDIVRTADQLEHLLLAKTLLSESESAILMILQKKNIQERWLPSELFLFHEVVSQYGLDYEKLQEILPKRSKGALKYQFLLIK